MILMTNTPLRDGVLRLLEFTRNEEWTFDRVLTADERERSGSERSPEIKELVARASAGRRAATQELRQALMGEQADDCADPVTGPVGEWPEVHRDAHAACVELIEALDRASEELLALDAGPGRNHPQYAWRDVLNYGVRGPLLSYAQWHHRADRPYEALSVLVRWYENARGAGLQTKVVSDASYDLACGMARAGRLDDAMRYLPDAFTYNDRGAVPVLKAWAREDPDLAPLAGRTDFRALVGAA
jgi:hypothetical protein